MKAFVCTVALLAMAGSGYAMEEYEVYQQDSAARFFNFNASDSSTTLVMLGALVLVAALAAIALAGGSAGALSPFAYDRNSYQQQGYGQYDAYAQQQ